MCCAFSRVSHATRIKYTKTFIDNPENYEVSYLDCAYIKKSFNKVRIFHHLSYELGRTVPS